MVDRRNGGKNEGSRRWPFPPFRKYIVSLFFRGGGQLARRFELTFLNGVRRAAPCGLGNIDRRKKWGREKRRWRKICLNRRALLLPLLRFTWREKTNSLPERIWMNWILEACSGYFNRSAVFPPVIVSNALSWCFFFHNGTCQMVSCLVSFSNRPKSLKNSLIGLHTSQRLGSSASRVIIFFFTSFALAIKSYFEYEA